MKKINIFVFILFKESDLIKRKGLSYKGYYEVKNTHKYIGKKPPYMRSKMENNFAIYCDNNNNVLKWSSEDITITYYGVDGNQHRYTPDFFVVIKDKNNNIKKLLIEVKPKKQSPGLAKIPVKPKKPTQKNMRRYYGLLKAYKTNQLKWTSARNYCASHGLEFVILTEDYLN